MVTPRKSVPEPSSGDPQIGPVRRFGNYTLIKKLATGGMAEIWLARQRGLAGFQRFIVIKKILSHLSEQKTFRDMFLDEARTSAQLNHPNIVQIYDLGNEVGSYYIAMEFIPGENLAAIAWRGMKRGKPFPPAFAARVIADTCKALHYAHHLKGPTGQPLEIVHRDISPQNILVTYEGEIKVVDFGIAKAATKSEHTKTGMLKGKFSYMSPEQCLGAPVDMRSDIFALGILLYELCTGKRLFKHESELMILEMITKRSVVPPSQVAPGITPGLEDIILRALEKDVKVRYQTAQHMQIALEEYLRDEGQQATNADIAAYMRELFADKIEEKRRLRELASREDFESQFGDEEPTEQALDSQRRRVVHGLPPSQVQVRAGTSPGPLAHPQHTPAMMAPPGATGSMPHMAGYASPSYSGGYPPGVTPPGYPPGAQGSGQYPLGYAGPSYSGQLPVQQDPGGGWVARVVIVGALIVIVVASLILYQQLNGEPTPKETNVNLTPQAPPVPRKTGSLTLKSRPQGAVIYLDGAPMTLADGTKAKTPSDLHSLQYGTTYKVELRLDGYRSFEQDVVMGEDTDGSTIDPEMRAFPGFVIAEVRGDDKASVRLFFNEEDAGLGPTVKKQIPGNTDVVVKAKLPGKICRASPKRIRVEPNTTKNTTITCRAQVVKAPAPVRRPGGAKNVRPRPQRPAKDEGCVTLPGMPRGFVTISTTPYSTIYYNGQKLGETPLSRVPLPSGCLRLTAKNTKLGLERKVKVEVEPNSVRIFKFSLDAK